MFNYLNMKYFYIFIFFLIISTNSNHVHAVDLSTTTPADNATQIAVNTDITLVWAGNVSTNSGNIILKKTSDDSTVESFATGSMFLISDMEGNVTAIISPSSDLDEDTEYYVLIDSSAFNGFDGISSKTTLNFKTVDNNNPSLSSSSPSDNEENVNVSSNIVLTFNEAVDAESGNITIKKTSDDSTIETIDVTGAKVSGSGSTAITINCGFKPAFIIMKVADASSNRDWYIWDDTRSNPIAKHLRPNLSNAEAGEAGKIAFTSTGVSITTNDDELNANGKKTIYMVFADKREYAYWLDQSGNNNDWTSNNLTESDISVDSPTNNFATGNPLVARTTYGWATLSEGNLQHTNTGLSSSWGGMVSTIIPSSGKYYAEVFCEGDSDGVIGVFNAGTFGLDHLLVSKTLLWPQGPPNK